MFKEVRAGYPCNPRCVVKISVTPAHVSVLSVNEMEQLRKWL